MTNFLICLLFFELVCLCFCFIIHRSINRSIERKTFNGNWQAGQTLPSDTDQEPSDTDEGANFTLAVPYGTVVTIKKVISVPVIPWSSYAEETREAAITHEGIRAGEIIGYRIWRAQPVDRLCSVIVGTVWEPGKTMQGNVEEWGVFAAKNPIDLPDLENYPFAVVHGTVELWGEIVEHENGYRAEFAKVRSIDSIRSNHYYCRTIKEFREIYGVR